MLISILWKIPQILFAISPLILVLMHVLRSETTDVRQVLFRRINNFDEDVSDQNLMCAVECLASATCNGYHITECGCQHVKEAVECMNTSAACFVMEILVPEAQPQRQRVSTLNITNGIPRGDWAPVEVCPDDSYAAGFKMRALENQGPSVDDEAVTALMLFCANITTLQPVANITSQPGYNGLWQAPVYCPADFWITAFTLRVEVWANYDNTAMNEMTVKCRGPGLTGSAETEAQGVIPTSLDIGWGEYGDWSASCPPAHAVCGLSTRVLGNLAPDQDNAGLTDAILICCSPPTPNL